MALMKNSLSSIFYTSLTGNGQSEFKKSEEGSVITLPVQKGGSEAPSLIKEHWKREIKKNCLAGICAFEPKSELVYKNCGLFLEQWGRRDELFRHKEIS